MDPILPRVSELDREEEGYTVDEAFKETGGFSK
jgi:hypothetical protein